MYALTTLMYARESFVRGGFVVIFFVFAGVPMMAQHWLGSLTVLNGICMCIVSLLQ